MWIFCLLADILLTYLYSRRHDAKATSWFVVFLFYAQIVGGILYYYVIYPRILSPLRHLPEPKGSRFLTGQTHNIFLGPSVQHARQWINETPNKGFIRYRTLWSGETLVITSPELISEVLVTKSYNFQKRPFMSRIFGPLLGNGVVFAEGAEHKRQRKHLMPPFAFTQVKKLYPIFWQHATGSAEAIASHIGLSKSNDAENCVYINEWSSRVALDIIGEAGMGQSFHAVDEPRNDLYVAYSTIFKRSSREQAKSIIKRLLLHFVTENAPYFTQFFTPDPNDPIVKAVRLIRGTCRGLIQSEKSSIEDNSNRTRQLSNANASTKYISGDSIITNAVASGAFTDEDLVNQAMTFLLAGHETTAGTLTMAIFYLCKHPNIQRRLREEVRTSLPDFGPETQITAEIIRGMPYLQAVCEEVLRLAPALPTSGRVPLTDTYIGDHFIPKGTTVLLPNAALNTSKAVWGEDALDFVPDRWLDAKRIPKTPYANMTFLHGPRSCMGKEFGRGSFACILSAWIGRFEFSLVDPDFEPTFKKTSLSMMVEGGVRVHIKELEG